MNDYLFAAPSLLEGIARNIDLFGTLQEYNFSNAPNESDMKAHQNDLHSLYNDMDIAIAEVLDRDE